ncbi:FtsX-like permease family protein [Allokutzneria sp. A3M-2-11 16]|uniref:FtsX-like permease family protein n=1 Tax=Allokutzneria sp. A3M-2-11 16 TaxID=2962043 RepID=UPI0020B81F79|nr:FtsX-like permease family protein [Allokutzneria sp. A3M-2-11 16]MCP3799053.1 FtsX-like permease family protein [Allokutzneria sp. A3M-2-11 16]
MTDALRRWFGDLSLGVRLAAAGGRGSAVRLAWITIGIGLGVAALLTAASAGSVLDSHEQRTRARIIGAAPDADRPVPGVSPLYSSAVFTEFAGRRFGGEMLFADGATPPKVPGVEVLPKPGEIVLSPALRDLLASPEGTLLLPRFPQRVTGILGDEGLSGPWELHFYVGVERAELPGTSPAYSVGVPPERLYFDPLLSSLVVIASVVLLIPVVVFVAGTARLSASARDRRLAALRLIGADAGQVRRIVAGESLAGALVGLVAGVVFFVVGRDLVDSVSLFGMSIYGKDIRPSPALALLVFLVVPVIAVGTALVALRRTLIEPLGVSRGARRAPRRLWWRLLPILAGVALLAGQHRGMASQPQTALVVIGVVLVLVGLPMVLPWLLERCVRRSRGGPLSWQLAMRRMGAHGGASWRIVGGFAALLAGGIAVQALLLTSDSIHRDESWTPTADRDLAWTTTADSESARRLAERLRTMPGVRRAVSYDVVHAQQPPHLNGPVELIVAPCPALRELTPIQNCAEGDVFSFPEPNGEIADLPPGTEFVLSTAPEGRLSWRQPERVRPIARPAFHAPWSGAGLLITPAAVGQGVPQLQHLVAVRLGEDDPLALEAIRNEIGLTRPLSFSARATPVSDSERTYTAIRRLVTVGSVAALAVAAGGLLVVAFEHVRHRRRQFAVLSATGVPYSTLAWSVLWQNAVPVVLGTGAALACGLGLATLVLNTTPTPQRYDWEAIGLTGAAAVLAVLLATVMTLPQLRRAMRSEGLRTE